MVTNTSRLFYRRKLATISKNATELSEMYREYDKKKADKYKRIAEACEADIKIEEAEDVRRNEHGVN